MNDVIAVERDERTVAVENSGYRLAYGVLTFALLIDIIFRGVVLNEAAWDLIALVIMGGGLCLAYQMFHQALPGNAIARGVVFTSMGLLAGAVAALLLTFSRA